MPDSGSDTSEGEATKRREKPESRMLREWMEAVSSYSRSLDKLIEENTNTKKEIKEVAGRLKRCVESSRKPAIVRWLEENRWETAPKQTMDMATMTTGGNAANTETVRITNNNDIATQTDNNGWNSRKDNAEENIRNKIATCRGFEGYKKLPTAEWPRQVFSIVIDTTGNPLWEGTENDLAFFAEKEDQLTKGVGRQLKRRFPEATELHKRPEGCEAVIYESKFMTTKEETTGKNRTSLTRILTDEDELRQYMNIVAWKTKVKDLGITRIGLWTDDIRWREIKKMIEHVFWGDNVKIMAYSPKGLPKNPDTRTLNKTSSRPLPRPSRRRENPQDAVLISAPNKSYADLLREVKGKVDATALGISVKGARSTRNGDLLITLKDGKHSAPILLDAIHKELGNGGVKARPGGRLTKILHIKGMDATATSEDLRNIIAKELNEDETGINVKSLRPAFGQCQNATVELDTERANKLLEKRTIRVGWSSCRIQERISVNRCNRCWAFGHNRSPCNGEDRTQACLKCAEEGHRVKDCQNTPFCPICQKRGHRADSMSCPAYRNEARIKADTRSRVNTDTQEARDYMSSRENEQQTTGMGAKSDSQTTLNSAPNND